MTIGTRPITPERRELLDRLYRGIDLPKAQFDMLVVAAIDAGCTYEQVSYHSALPTSTVFVIVRRARASQT